MKRMRSLKILATAALSLLLLFAFAATAYAAEATYNGTYAGSLFGFDPGSAATGLFPQLQDLMPGGKYTQKITVKNGSTQSVSLYLRGYQEEQQSEKSKELLSKVTFSLTSSDGAILVNESANTPMNAGWPGTGTDTGDGIFVALGWFDPGVSKELTLTINVPKELDNSFQSIGGKVIWMFQADVYTGGGDDDDDDDRPRRTPIPLGPGFDITVDGNPIPLSPGTGDDTNFLLWGGVLAAFLAALTGLLFYNKRRRKV